MTFQEITNSVKNIKPKRGRLIIGIDGGGGAGKSTFAKILSTHLKADLISLDLLYKPINQRVNENQNSDLNVDFDWARIDGQIFDAIRNNKPIIYQEYDWDKDRLTNTYTIPVESPLIIEGGYCLQNKYFEFYDFTIWIEAPSNIRLSRVLARDGEHMRSFWENAWLPAEQRYVEYHRPKERAALLINGVSSDFKYDKIDQSK